MDITAPPIEEQAAPPPQLEMQQGVDVVALVRRAVAQQPHGTADQIADSLAEQGHQVSRIWIARLLQREHQA